MDSNQRQPGPGSTRSNGQPGGAAPDQWSRPAAPPTGNPATGNGHAPHAWQPPAGQPPHGSHPPEHQPWARPPHGAPNAGPAGQPGYPPPAGYQPYPGQSGQSGQPGPSAGGQPPYPGYAPYAHQPAGRPPDPSYPGQPGQRPGFSAGPPVAPKITKRRGSILPALFFGVLALVLGVLAVYLYVQERGDNGPVAPTAMPAQNQYANVNDALEDTGLTVVEATRTDPGATSPSSFPRGTVGQFISIEGQQAWVYIFPDADTQETAATAFAADPEPLTTASRKPLTTAPPALFHHSNVIVLVSTDNNLGQDVSDRIQQAVESLP